ncbi:MAG TPA: AI-2E family transporter [Gammaproteobacteria bacterium]|nr:AI-2E family transporter [Gammaproteobacteria bacterium]
MGLIRDWFDRHFSDPQVVILTGLLVSAFAVILLLGDMLMPVLASLVIAYLLEGLVRHTQKFKLPRLPVVAVVVVLFFTALIFVILGLLPLLSNQIAQFVQELPSMMGKGQELLLRLPEKYPQFFSGDQVDELINGIRAELASLGQHALSLSVTSVVGLITLLVYLVLMPMLVFFFLKDKDKILGWMSSYLPPDLGLVRQIWQDVDRQIGNYIRGKMIEILLVWVATYIAFVLMGLQFALLLSMMVGLSVLVPYIGAVVVTIPVTLIAYYQWGVSSEFVYLMVAYGVIQAIDGNIVVPLLFSEVVNLHPIAIIVSVLVFGGLWGFWGVFFAIPLATLVQAILVAWPRLEARAIAERG